MILQYIAATKKCKETSRFDGMTSQFQNFSKLVLGLILHNYFAKKTANKVLALIALSAATVPRVILGLPLLHFPATIPRRSLLQPLMPEGALHIFWMRVVQTGRVSIFKILGIRNGISFDNFGIMNGTDFQGFGIQPLVW